MPILQKSNRKLASRIVRLIS